METGITRKFDLYVPESLQDLLGYLNRNHEGVVLIANGSDLINRMGRRQVSARTLADLSGLSELRYVRRENGEVKIGALTTLTDLVESPIIRAKYPVFLQVAEKFGAAQILNVATVGGNVCAASSSEDLIPALLVLDARVRIVGLNGERHAKLEDFIVGKRQVDLRPGELVAETSFRELGEDEGAAFDKLGMRNSLIIAFVNVAVYLHLDIRSEKIRKVRVALNRVREKIPQRAKNTEKSLLGKTLTSETAQEASSVLGTELQLTSDFRVPGEYRLEAAKVFFRRTLLKCKDQIVSG